jgi:peptidoglycan/LPS O-acetylase OafA/YrhL
VALLSFVHAAWLGRTNSILAFYLITSRFWELGAGVLLYQFMVYRGRKFDLPTAPRLRSHWVGVAVSLFLIGYGFSMADPRSVPFPGAIAPVLGTLGILGFLHGQAADGYVMKALQARLAQALRPQQLVETGKPPERFTAVSGSTCMPYGI